LGKIGAGKILISRKEREPWSSGYGKRLTFHVPKVVGSNPSTVYWMDIFTHLFVVKICTVCLKRPKINKKRPGLAHFLKKERISWVASAIT